VHNYIYIRGEMMREYLVLQKAVDEAYARGYLGKNILGTGIEVQLTVHRGAGAYICGEETALLNSLEGLRGQPRLKPPFPAVKGLFGNPTIVNNVETLMNVPFIIDKGGAWFNALGMGRSGGTRIVCVSGHVNQPGVFELPMGISFNAIINDVCGGVWKGRRVKAVIPGGVSMPPLDASELDVPCEFDALQTDERIKPVMVREGQTFDLGGGRVLRTMAGSGGIVVMDDQTDIPRALWRIMKFFAHESCGQCTPCREGCGWLEKVSRRVADGKGKEGDIELLASIAHGIAGNTICALGDAAAWPMLGFLTKFRADFEAKIASRKGRAA
jgi:NADH-quinone oxidoreductase subunit F